MDKQIYLANEHVADFVKWLSHELVYREFQLVVLDSRFVPGGINEQVVGVEGVLEQYMWCSRWTPPGEEAVVESGNWATTIASLARLKHGLENAIEARDENLTFEYCQRVLAWAGICGSLPFLTDKKDGHELVSYLRDAKPLFRLDDSELHLEMIDATRIHRFDSGLTKIHSILDDSGAPIYDSRVGAATAMFVALYCRERKLARTPEWLRFPTGEARGNQLRNSRDLDFPSAPRLYSAFRGANWARCMVRLGWIMEAVVLSTGLFGDQSPIRDRLVALQSAFFMLGYDLRAFGEGQPTKNVMPLVASLVESDRRRKLERPGNCVPTGFSMNRVVELFGRFLEENNRSPFDQQEFIDWQMEHGGVTSRNTARANCYPLTAREFDLFGAPLEICRHFIRGGLEGLVGVLRGRVPAVDERELVCMYDCYFAGSLADRIPAERVEWLLAHGHAGTEDAAKTLLSVGRSVGRHFGLIGPGGPPTIDFGQFFDDGPWEK